MFETSLATDVAVSSRHSVRAFLPKPVEQALLDHILSVSARAPSGTNLQPWRVHVLTGAGRQRLVDAVCAEFDRYVGRPPSESPHVAEYDYYPREFFGVYKDRRRKIGFDLYALLGIGKEDKARMAHQHRRNYAFFDAPVGLIFTIDRRMGKGSWLDYGMFLQNIMIVAKAHGLDTCPQAAWVEYHRVIGKQLGFGEQEQLVCGMALGYADSAALENTLVTERVSLPELVVRHD
ncbi:MAG: nitroreductase [Rhodocyclaceae bacterium]|nr:nitroreductase [Rhodocyclaceae bacterium]MBK6907352.1 nitroreductase [Rhodocyclaceae bacterium]